MKKLCCVLFIVSCLVGAVRAEDAAAGSKGSLPPPEKNEMTMTELKASFFELDGRVVKTTINTASDITQRDEKTYYANCGYHGLGGGAFSLPTVLIPAEGKDFFQALSKISTGDNPQFVYLLVTIKNPVQIGISSCFLKAVGNYYDEATAEYSWTPVEISETAEAPLPPPEKKEMRMDELKMTLMELDGKVIETKINYVYSLEQKNERWYSAYCSYSSGSGGSSSESVCIPIEGKNFFQDMSKRGFGGSAQVVFLRVHSKNPIRIGTAKSYYRYTLEAVGTRYSKSKNEYSW